MVTMVLFCLMMLNIGFVQAILSTHTANVIHGTAPYLTFDNGAIKVTNTDELLRIALSDGTQYTKATNTSTASNPIELPVAGQSFNDIKTLLPTTLTSVNLNTLIGSPYNNWGDDDGDGQGTGGISATGTLSLILKDVNNNTVNLNDMLLPCYSPYTLTLASTAGTLSTQYGAPNSTLFTASSATYYIRPKIGASYVCWAQPNLSSNGGTYSGPTDQWDDTKGFLPQSVPTPPAVPSTPNPGSNFPTMGAKGLFFNLTVAGALGSDVTYSKSPASSSIDLNITAKVGSNVAKVELTGPSNGVTAAQAATAVATTFKLYSDTAKTNEIYSFTIGKWFIVKPGNGGGYPAAQTYCTYLSQTGSNYSVPGVAQYTNGNGFNWVGGLAGQDNNYQRRIGGGLFAEWGYTSFGYYTGSDFEYIYYWAAESYGTNQYEVNSGYGYVYYFLPTYSASRVACVK